MKLFVWDFHGVLEKDNEKAVIDISNQILAKAGYKERFTEEDNERLYGLKWYQYFEHLLPGLDAAEHLALQTACFEFAEENLDLIAGRIKPNDHAGEVLGHIAQSPHHQIVISNTRPADLVWFLDTVGISQWFDQAHIIGVNAHQTHQSKLDALKAFLAGRHFDQIVVIGDSVNDLKLGRQVGAKTYFYKHPHRRHEDTTYADSTITDLRAVLKEL
jgi:phosphoglycolate phosphatase-like HAD superfamily hydrolase